MDARQVGAGIVLIVAIGVTAACGGDSTRVPAATSPSGTPERPMATPTRTAPATPTPRPQVLRLTKLTCIWPNAWGVTEITGVVENVTGEPIPSVSVAAVGLTTEGKKVILGGDKQRTTMFDYSEALLGGSLATTPADIAPGQSATFAFHWLPDGIRNCTVEFFSQGSRIGFDPNGVLSGGFVPLGTR